MNITEKFDTFMVAGNPAYGDELNGFIQMHNQAVADIAQRLTVAAIGTLLIKKGIVSESEMMDELTQNMAMFEETLAKVEQNRDMILELVESTVDLNDNLKDMYEDIENLGPVDEDGFPVG